MPFKLHALLYIFNSTVYFVKHALTVKKFKITSQYIYLKLPYTLSMPSKNKDKGVTPCLCETAQFSSYTLFKILALGIYTF